MSHVKHVPKDAQVIMSIMKDMGIIDYEPKVINQLLEFTYHKYSVRFRRIKQYLSSDNLKPLFGLTNGSGILFLARAISNNTSLGGGLVKRVHYAPLNVDCIFDLLNFFALCLKQHPFCAQN
ncbi:hypothetical protein M0802_005002 [Mischocyttarus mexicanus]|nr:hypothetical protein M0802_005002 [Mischocyttarus mexicanus]